MARNAMMQARIYCCYVNLNPVIYTPTGIYTLACWKWVVNVRAAWRVFTPQSEYWDRIRTPGLYSRPKAKIQIAVLNGGTWSIKTWHRARQCCIYCSLEAHCLLYSNLHFKITRFHLVYLPWVPPQLCKGSLAYYQVSVRSEKSVLMVISFIVSTHNRKMNSTTVHGCFICVVRSVHMCFCFLWYSLLLNWSILPDGPKLQENSASFGVLFLKVL